MNQTAIVEHQGGVLANTSVWEPEKLDSEIGDKMAVAREQARIQTKYILAIKAPRNILAARAKLLSTCQRRRFAESARYCLAFGGSKVVGPSIRMAEEIARALGNVSTETYIKYDGPDKRVICATATDLESRVDHSLDVVVPRFVERKSVKAGQRVMSTRTNDKGQTIYTVEAPEHEFKTACAAADSKALRTVILRLAPRDLVDDAMDACQEAVRGAFSEDDSAKQIADSFSKHKVAVEEIEAYLGHSLERLTADEYADLRGIWTSIRDGAATWETATGANPAVKDKGKPSGTEKLKARVMKGDPK